jgi:hypothetical protein
MGVGLVGCRAVRGGTVSGAMTAHGLFGVVGVTLVGLHLAIIDY